MRRYARNNIDAKRPFIIKRLLTWLDLPLDSADAADAVKQYLPALIAADPVANKTKGKKTPYVNMILDWEITRKIRLFEDVETIHNTLAAWNKLSNTIPELRQHRNYEFKSPGEIRELIEPYIEQISEFDKYKFLTKVAEYSDYSMYIVHNWDEGERAFADSGWCVQHKDHFDGYGAPFFMITKNNKRFALLHIGKNPQTIDIKNKQDDNLSRKQRDDIKPLLMATAVAKTHRGIPISLVIYTNMILESPWPEAEEYIKRHPMAAYLYAKNIIKSRFPEAEKYIKLDPAFWNAYVEFIKTKGYAANPRRIARLTPRQWISEIDNLLRYHNKFYA